MVDDQPHGNTLLFSYFLFPFILISSSSPLSQLSSPLQIEFFPRICLSTDWRHACGTAGGWGLRARERVRSHVCLLTVLSHLKAALSLRQHSSSEGKEGKRPWAAAYFDKDGPRGNKRKEPGALIDRWVVKNDRLLERQGWKNWLWAQSDTLILIERHIG